MTPEQKEIITLMLQKIWIDILDNQTSYPTLTPYEKRVGYAVTHFSRFVRLIDKAFETSCLEWEEAQELVRDIKGVYADVDSLLG